MTKLDQIEKRLFSGHYSSNKDAEDDIRTMLDVLRNIIARLDKKG